MEKQVTKQQAFNKVWRHFVRDKAKRAIRMYEGQEGNVCPVGILMTKKERKELHSKIVDVNNNPHLANVARIVTLDRSGLLPDRLRSIKGFLFHLQVLNDENDRFGRVKERAGILRKFATEWELDIPED